MEDHDIVELFLMRDETAIERTSEKYGNRLRALSYGIVNDAQTAEECEKCRKRQNKNACQPFEADNAANSSDGCWDAASSAACGPLVRMPSKTIIS